MTFSTQWVENLMRTITGEHYGEDSLIKMQINVQTQDGKASDLLLTT